MRVDFDRYSENAGYASFQRNKLFNFIGKWFLLFILKFNVALYWMIFRIYLWKCPAKAGWKNSAFSIAMLLWYQNKEKPLKRKRRLGLELPMSRTNFYGPIEILTHAMLNKLRCHTHFKFSANLDPDCWYKFTYWIVNSANLDQLVSSEANCSGSTLFAKAGHNTGSAGLSVGDWLHFLETVFETSFLHFQLLVFNYSGINSH